MAKFFWIDLEMTGLDETRDVILEVAALITTTDLEVLDEYHGVVRQDPRVLETMDPWCLETHGKSGLTGEVPHGKDLATVEAEVLAMVDRHFAPDVRVILCGNSVSTDRRFIDRGMTALARRLHYRVIDVSSFKEVFAMKYGLTYKKNEGHRALPDIRESLGELKFYLGFVTPPPPAE